jgi:hypothetical protein
MAPPGSMSLRDKIPESHVMAAAAAQESTVEILKSVRPKAEQPDNRRPSEKNSFIEDVDLWVKKYLSLADEVLQSPTEPEDDGEKSAA